MASRRIVGENERHVSPSRAGDRRPERVQVYEKIKPGIWNDNGVFHLLDSWTEHRVVFKFRLEAVEGEENVSDPAPERPSPRRIIPTSVKLEVSKREGGKCVRCGASDDLHFDHDVPFSLGGTSMTAANVQLLCAPHNLEKSDSIV
jgi:hypothetical protein